MEVPKVKNSVETINIADEKIIANPIFDYLGLIPKKTQKKNLKTDSRCEIEDKNMDIVCVEEVDPLKMDQTDSAEMEIVDLTIEYFTTPVINSSEEIITSDRFAIKTIIIPGRKATEKLCQQCCLKKKCLFKVANKDIFICNKTCLVLFRTLNTPALLETHDFLTKCSECSKKIDENDTEILSWQVMNFCDKKCLSKYFNKIGLNCTYCKKVVTSDTLGKYCVRFIHGICQFCNRNCLEMYKNVHKFCLHCQTDISNLQKEFCSQFCSEKYALMNRKTSKELKKTCSFCNWLNETQVQFYSQTRNGNKRYRFCSNYCFVAFKFTNKIDAILCEFCKIYFENCSQCLVDKNIKTFCSEICKNSYIIQNRKLIACVTCKVQKNNFDMIGRSYKNGYIWVCSFNCLNLFEISSMKCDFCLKANETKYHFKLDTEFKKFCSYDCLIAYQLYISDGFSLDNLSDRVRTATTIDIKDLDKEIEITSQPITRQQNSTVLPPLPMKNVSILCKPISHTKSVSCKPNNLDKNTQTESYNLLPIPTQIPFPVPIPLPVFIPAQNSSIEIEKIKQSDLETVKQNTLLKDELKIVKKLDKYKNQLEISRKKSLNHTLALNAFKQWITMKDINLKCTNILNLTFKELTNNLCLFVKKYRKPNGLEYAPDTIYYLCLGIQKYLLDNQKTDDIFTDKDFTDCLDEIAKKFLILFNDSKYIITRIKERYLWESGQLGSNSPYTLLNTVLYFNTKYFHIETVEEHLKLSFSQIWKSSSKKWIYCNEKKIVCELPVNEKDPLYCPTKYYEFYISKCPDNVKTQDFNVYLLPEQNSKAENSVWYSTKELERRLLEKMFDRIRMVEEINNALFSTE